MTEARADIAALLAPGMRVGGDSASGPIIDVEHDGHRGQVSLFGGQLLSWQPAGHEPVLWLSPGAVFDRAAPIRGGIPVCWPWFADHPTETGWPSHGFARTATWEVARTESASATVRLTLPNAADQATYWRHTSRPRLTYRIGDDLGIDLSLKNTDTSPIELSQALHTYFAVGDIEAISIAGLEQCPFHDKLTGSDVPAAGAPIAFAAETDRIYRHLTGPIELRDPVLGRTITIAHDGATNVIVWNPWVEKSARLGDIGPADAYRGMVCIETGNVAPDLLRLDPGETHALQTTVSVRKDP